MTIAIERLGGRRLGRFVATAALALVVTACAGQAPPSSWPGISLADDTVYLAYNQQVYAINAANGQLRWSFPTEPQSNTTFFADPVVGDELLIAGSYANTSVYALNPSNGSQVWPQPFADPGDHIVGGAAVDGGKVYVPSADYSVYALDAASGQRQWSFKAEQAIWAQPLIVNETVYVTSLDHHIYALSTADGSELWATELGGAIAGTPAVADGLLIVGAFDNNLYAVNAESGAIEWTQATEGWVWSGPLVQDGKLYYGDLAGYLYTADPATGTQAWKVKPGGAIRGTPALADGVLYAPARDGFVYFRSADDGSAVAPQEVEIGGQLLSTPIIHGDLLILAAYGAQDNKLVFALDLKTGAERWSFTAP
jgi:outer membrane protein assembly factor BamB